MSAKRATRHRVYALVTTCLVVFAIEFLCRGAYRLTFGESYSRTRLEELAWPSEWQRIAAGSDARGRPGFLKREIHTDQNYGFGNAQNPDTFTDAASD